MRFLLIIIAAVISALLGRMGGSGKYPRQTRVIGIPVLMAGLAWLLGIHSWWLLLMIPAMIGAISTYHDYIGFDNFWLHGFVIGCATFPIALYNGHWWMFAFRCLFLAVSCGGWSQAVKNDVLEELGRYFLVPLCLFML